MTRLLLALSVLATPTWLWAEEPAHAWPALDVSELSTVYVLDDQGMETMGKLLRLDVDSIVLVDGGGEHRFEAARVRRIQRQGDSLRNGALTGALVGAGIGSITAGIMDCPAAAENCAGARVAGFLVSTAVYAAIGTAIDALIKGRTTLYKAPRTTAGAKAGLSISPEYGVRAALHVRFAW